MNTKPTYRKTALVIALFLALLSAASLIYLLLPTEKETEYTADIYQDGTLIMSIPLHAGEDGEIFTIEGEGGCTNEVEIREGSIGIISADCPDKLCVRQGFISDSRLPVTCLPNRLVIRLRPSSGDPDAVTY